MPLLRPIAHAFLGVALLAAPFAYAAVPTTEITGSVEAGSGSLAGIASGAGFITNSFGSFASFAGNHLEIAAGARLFAPPDSTGRAIGINSSLNNLGLIEAAIGFENNGLNIGGFATNGSQGTSAGVINVATLSVYATGTFVNAGRTAGVSGSKDAIINTGTYPLPGIGQATFVVNGKVFEDQGFGIGGIAENRGTWNSYANGSVGGTLINTGTFTSRNTPGTVLDTPITGFYEQSLNIGVPFANVRQGVLLNYGTLRTEAGTKFRINGLVENHGTMRSFDYVEVHGAGTLWNRQGGAFTMEANSFGRLRQRVFLPSNLPEALINDGRFTIASGALLQNDIEGFAGIVNQATGEFTIASGGRLEQTRVPFVPSGPPAGGPPPGAAFRNEGTMFVTGQFVGGIVENSGRIVIAPSASARMDVDLLYQTAGTLAVNGTFVGNLILQGGVLAGGGLNAKINGGVFFGGLGGGPSQEPPNCGALGYACFRPGNSPGHLTIDGPLVIGENGVLELEIERDASGMLQWDTVRASSIDFQFGSVIEVVVAPNVGDITGQTFNFLDCGFGCAYDGVTTRVLGGAGDFDFGKDGLVFTAAPVPEPRIWAMFAAGLFIAGFAVRRRARPCV